MKNLSDAEAAYAHAITLSEPARSAALVSIADQIRSIAWSAHSRPVAMEIASGCEARVSPTADILAGMNEIFGDSRFRRAS